MTSPPLAVVIETFRRWLHLPDLGALLILLATVAANRLRGEPVWLLLVAAPGHTKTELLAPLAVLEEVKPAATLTAPSLLSGTSKRETARNAKGGLLREIGDYGIILEKDFGSVLNQQRDTRAETLAALREVYDGSWVRYVGTDGGKALAWSGKVGFVGGCTPAIDRAHAVMAAMGERFLLYRVRAVDEKTQARRALRNVGHEGAMRAELRNVVADFFAKLDLPSAPLELTDSEIDRLVALTRLCARARSAVERDGYSREIELVPGSEAPTRLAKVLSGVYMGLRAIGVSETCSWSVVTRAATDSVPAMRWRLLAQLFDGTTRNTTELASVVGLPTITTRRALEDLSAYGLLVRSAGGKGKADLWQAGRETLSLAREAGVSEMSGSPMPSSFFDFDHALEDISEKVYGNGSHAAQTPLDEGVREAFGLDRAEAP